jgi:hypothetical protein
MGLLLMYLFKIGLLLDCCAYKKVKSECWDRHADEECREETQESMAMHPPSVAWSRSSPWPSEETDSAELLEMVR